MASGGRREASASPGLPPVGFPPAGEAACPVADRGRHPSGVAGGSWRCRGDSSRGCTAANGATPRGDKLPQADSLANLSVIPYDTPEDDLEVSLVGNEDAMI
jgi:hypothetical protein